MSGKLKPCPFCSGEPMYDDTYGIGTVFCTKCGTETAAGFTGNGKKENAIKQWNTRAAGWIKTSERLPEENQCVLLVFEFKPWKPQVYFGCMEASKMWYIYGLGGYVKDVPYWMPLPELPEIEGRAEKV